MRVLIILCGFLAVSSGTALAHESLATRAEIALDEQTGRQIPADAFFTDENGIRKRLRDFITRPTIIAPVYFSCNHACPLLLNGLADVLGKIEMMRPGRDFQVITLSFDENDTPAVARDKKRNYLTAVGRPFPAEAWTFLTGAAPDIKAFTDSIGFTFQRDGESSFSHPVTLVMIAPGGRIIRYIEGTRFLPFEVTMAVTEAAEGKVTSPIRKALTYCFSYNPQRKTYVFNILKVTGGAMLVTVLAVFAWLMITSGRHRARAREQ